MEYVIVSYKKSDKGLKKPEIVGRVFTNFDNLLTKLAKLVNWPKSEVRSLGEYSIMENRDYLNCDYLYGWLRKENYDKKIEGLAQ